jgi:hypothetical protein
MAESLNNKIKITQAEANSADKERLANLKKMEDLQRTLAELEEKNAKGQKKQAELIKKEIKSTNTILKVLEKEVALQNKKVGALKKQKKIQDDLNSGVKSVVEEYKNLAPEIQKQLELDGTKADLYMELQTSIKNQQSILKNGNKEEKASAEKKIELYQDITTQMLEQAKAVDEADMELRGKKEIDFKIREIKLLQERNKLSEEEAERAIKGLEYAEKLENIAEALNEIAEKQGELFHAVPEELQESVKGAMGFGKALAAAGMAAGPLLLIVAGLAAAVHAFVELDEAGSDYRKNTGLTVKQTEHLDHQVHDIAMEYRSMGVAAKEVYAVSEQLGNVFSNVAHFSTETLGALSAIVARTGTTAENAAKVQSVFESIGGVSSETAASMQMQVASLAQQAGAAPKEVLDDIADSAEITSKYFKGDINLLKQQAIQANRLGTTLDGLAKTAEKLLDFEGGIEEELVASTFVGGQFNLSRARALAMEGKLAEAQEETLSQIQRSGDFRKQDYFTQQQLAKAAGMEVGEITKQLNMQERLAHLGEEEKKLAMQAVEAGLDVTDLTDEQLKNKTAEFAENQRITGQLDEMKNKFAGITETVGGALMPIISALAPVLRYALWPLEMAAKGVAYLAEGIAQAKAPAIALASILAGMAYNSIKTAVSAIFSSLGQIPFGVGLALAGAATVGLFSTLSKADSAVKTGDVMSPAGGKTQISTKEGGLLELSPNDDVVAAPNLINSLESKRQGGALSQIQTNLGTNYTSKLVDKMDSLIAAVSANKDTYLDGSKVTSNLKRVSDKSNRNNFALA